MSNSHLKQTRHISLWGATGIGVSAIVGGGILALSGDAFALTGEGTLLVFILNGLLAFITALSFAELASTFPHNGGLYAFARRLLSVGPAFGVGFVVWFASILASVLYCIGFAAFVTESLKSLFAHSGFLNTIHHPLFLPILSIASYILSAGIIIRSPGGGGQFVNIAKMTVFGILILGGAGVWIHRQFPLPKNIQMFPAGNSGFIQAMGLTFIALQGFDLIAAVAGEVKDPARTLPKSMLLSLIIALLVYIPLLLVLILAGVPEGMPIRELAGQNPAALVAVCARHFLGGFGYWLVILAGILSMFSALLANLFAAARIASSMAIERTLPPRLETIHPYYGTPVTSILVTGGIGILCMFILTDVATSGAASSLIFLLSFSLAHALCLLCRKRKPVSHQAFQTPFFPYLPILGLVLCLALSIYQAINVPAAGMVVLIWLIIGHVAYSATFSARARIFDAASEFQDPELLALRGQSPLVLVPIANPATLKSWLLWVEPCLRLR